MKGSYALKKLWLFCSLAGSLFAEQGYLSDLKEKQFSYDYEKVQLQGDMLRESWLQPVVASYSYMKNDQYGGDTTLQNMSVSIDQPIFQSGGIYYGIKFAEASRRYSTLSVDAARTKMIKETVALAMQIHQNQFRLEKQKLLAENAKLNLELKTEQYLHGELDSGFLDNAIIEKNLQMQALYDLEAVREKLLSAFSALSDLDPKNVPIPQLQLISKEAFEQHSLDLDLARSEIEKARWNANVTRAKYLPRVSLVAAHTWDTMVNPAFIGRPMNATFETTYTTYGLKASMMFDFNEFRDMELSRVEYLKSQSVLADSKRETRRLFDEVRHNLDKADKKIALAEENRQLYAKLLEDTKELFKAGYKTEYDVNMLANSASIQAFEKKIIELDRQLELLALYEKVYGAI